MLRKAIVTLAAAASFAVAAPAAQAHLAVGSHTAEMEVYNKHKWRCGSTAWGTTWCLRFVSLTSQQHPNYPHSYEVRLTWNEAKIGTTYACGLLALYNTHTRQSFVTKGPSCHT